MPSVLIVTRDATLRDHLSEVMGAASFQVAVAGDPARVQRLARILAFDAVLIDRTSWAAGEARALVEELRKRSHPRALQAVAVGPGDAPPAGFDSCIAFDATDYEVLAAALRGQAPAPAPGPS